VSSVTLHPTNSFRTGDWKCGSGKCNTVKNARVENAGTDRRGGKCRSRLAVWKAEPILYSDTALIKLLPEKLKLTLDVW